MCSFIRFHDVYKQQQYRNIIIYLSFRACSKVRLRVHLPLRGLCGQRSGAGGARGAAARAAGAPRGRGRPAAARRAAAERPRRGARGRPGPRDGAARRRARGAWWGGGGSGGWVGRRGHGHGARARLSALSLSLSTTPYSLSAGCVARSFRGKFRGEAEVLPPRERLRGRLGLQVPRLGRARGQLELPGRRPPVQGEAPRA